MPKIKTHSGAKKRFSVTKNGKFKRGHVGKRHLLNGHGKTTKLKRHLRKEGFADSTNVAQLKRLLPYKSVRKPHLSYRRQTQWQELRAQ